MGARSPASTLISSQREPGGSRPLNASASPSSARRQHRGGAEEMQGPLRRWLAAQGPLGGAAAARRPAARLGEGGSGAAVAAPRGGRPAAAGGAGAAAHITGRSARRETAAGIPR